MNEPGEAAYIQVKDLSKNENEKVFVFNGWTFSQILHLNQSITLFMIYGLESCENV